jgi:uncharacterized protein YndB with AHSA1/START domain
MTLLWILLAVLGAVVVVVLLIASSRSDDLEIKRDITITAPPEKVFGLIDDFHHWPRWSPWEKLDPELQRSHSGAPKGVGAVYTWQGNSKVGQGRMEITEASEPSFVVIDLEFIAPWKAHNVTRFELAPAGDGAEVTQVTWRMLGQRPFMMKVMSVFMDMDSLVGKDFESGLAAMKQAAES